MIPLEKLKSLKRAYVHSSCPDGTASALVLKDALPDLDVRFVKYDTKEHKEIVPEPDTIFCDFSPWLPKDARGTFKMTNEEANRRVVDQVLREKLIEKWNEAGVIVLDHHDRAIVEPYTFGVFGENDKLECGAMLAYREVWLELRGHEPSILSLGRQVQHFARLAAIRDTWKRDDPDFELACRQAAVLQFFKLEQLSFELVEEMQTTLAPRLFERQIELAHSCIKEAYGFVSEKGTRVLMFQGVSATSDAAEILERAHAEHPHIPPQQPDLIVGFHYRNETCSSCGGGGGNDPSGIQGSDPVCQKCRGAAQKLKLQFSTRSHTGFDCRAFAQAHGGNGHEKAAGFTIAVEDSYDPYAQFAVLLRHYEASR